VFTGFVFAVAFADLLLDFFGDHVDAGVKIGLVIFSVEVRARHGQAHRTLELPVGGLGGVVLKDDPGIDGKAIEVFELPNPGENVIFNRLGQRHIMRRKNKFHINYIKDALPVGKNPAKPLRRGFYPRFSLLFLTQPLRFGKRKLREWTDPQDGLKQSLRL